MTIKINTSEAASISTLRQCNLPITISRKYKSVLLHQGIRINDLDQDCKDAVKSLRSKGYKIFTQLVFFQDKI